MLDIDAADDTLGGRTSDHVILKSCFCVITLFRGQLEEIMHVNTGNFQNTIDIFDITGYGSIEEIAQSANLFSGQRLGQCAQQSTAHGADNMIQGGGMLLFGINPVKLFYSAVDTIINRLIKAADIGDPCGTFFACNDYMRLMNNFPHNSAPFFYVFFLSIVPEGCLTTVIARAFPVPPTAGRQLDFGEPFGHELRVE